MARPFDAISWMWDEALTAIERAERRHRRFFALLGGRALLPVWEPPADVFETDDEVWIVVALPGVRSEQITLSLGTSDLVVRTQRVPPPAPEYLRIKRMEIPYGAFERRIELSPGRYTLLEHQLVNGCLELRLAKE